VKLAEVREALVAKEREVKMLEGRVRGYQSALMTKTEAEGHAKHQDCAECGALWPASAAPTHRHGCSKWREYFRVLDRRSGFTIKARKRPARRKA
jgi:hypothetical protein